MHFAIVLRTGSRNRKRILTKKKLVRQLTGQSIRAQSFLRMKEDREQKQRTVTLDESEAMVSKID